MKEVIIRLGEGEINKGFKHVFIELKSDGKILWQDNCQLEGNRSLTDLLYQWWFLYSEVLKIRSPLNSRSTVVFDEDTVTNVSTQDLKELNYNLRKEINGWLDRSDFNRIEKKLRTDLSIKEAIAVIIITEGQLTWQLPWHYWRFFDDYPQAVEMFWYPQATINQTQSIKKYRRINILGLFGENSGLNLENDRTLLTSLPNSKVNLPIVNSVRQISQILMEESLNIFCFSGHGDTIAYDINQTIDLSGIIYLNQNTSLEISRLKQSLEIAVEKGLTIAIFNCCKGLGLAQQLTSINIPYLVVMRGEIPDQLAYQFLKDLLTQYSKGKTFPQSFKFARQQLTLENLFPDFLPILFHNPLSNHLNWSDLTTPKLRSQLLQPLKKITPYFQQPKYRLWIGLTISLFLTTIALNLNSLNPITSLNNNLINQLQSIIYHSQPRSPHVTIINYDRLNINGHIHPKLLNDTIIKISQQAKPIAWGINLIIDDTEEKYPILTEVITGCITRAKLPNTLDYPLSLNSCQHQSLPLKLLKKSGKSLPNIDTIKLNPHLLSQIKTIDISKIKTLPNQTIKELFDGKIIIVGVVNQQNQFLNDFVTLDAIATEQVFLSQTPSNPIPLYQSWDSGLQFIWIFLWLNLAINQILASPIIRTIIIIVIQMITGLILLFIGSGVPLIITTAIMLTLLIISPVLSLD